MMTTNNRFVTVFGETGFLGRRAVHLIRKNGFRSGPHHQGTRTGRKCYSLSMSRSFNPGICFPKSLGKKSNVGTKPNAAKVLD